MVKAGGVCQAGSVLCRLESWKMGRSRPPKKVHRRVRLFRRFLPISIFITSMRPGTQAQEPDGVFTVIVAIGAKLIQDQLLILLAGFAITFVNRFKIFAPGTFYHITVSFSVTCNMAQRYFLEYFSFTFNVAQFVIPNRRCKIGIIFYA